MVIVLAAVLALLDVVDGKIVRSLLYDSEDEGCYEQEALGDKACMYENTYELLFSCLLNAMRKHKVVSMLIRNLITPRAF